MEQGRLVYFHNHGNPGPGLYRPKEWRFNRAQFEENGQMLDDLDLVRLLEPLPPEGFYRVAESYPLITLLITRKTSSSNFGS